MSEILKKRVKESYGKPVTVFTSNGFRYDGVITGMDDTYVEMVRDHNRGYKLILIKEIKEVDIKNG